MYIVQTEEKVNKVRTRLLVGGCCCHSLGSLIPERMDRWGCNMQPWGHKDWLAVNRSIREDQSCLVNKRTECGAFAVGKAEIAMHQTEMQLRGMHHCLSKQHWSIDWYPRNFSTETIALKHWLRHPTPPPTPIPPHLHLHHSPPPPINLNTLLGFSDWGFAQERINYYINKLSYIFN